MSNADPIPLSPIPRTSSHRPVSPSGDETYLHGTDDGFRPNPIARTETSNSRTVDNQALRGYPSLAYHIGRTGSLAIYRRFASLNARSLLYLQAEIVDLEHELNDLEQGNREHEHLRYSVRKLRKSKRGSIEWRLWDKVREVRDKLDQYNRLLLEQKNLHDLAVPSVHDVRTLYNLVHQSPEGTEETPWLGWPEDSIWELVTDKGKIKTTQEDLVSLSNAFGSDPFTRWFTSRVLYLFHAIYKGLHGPDNEELDTYEYSDAVINRIINATTLVVASLLPTSSIIALYFISNPLVRLVFILAFSALFTTCLSLFTAATRIEIFAASVALASVQAVFVGTNFGN